MMMLVNLAQLRLSGENFDFAQSLLHSFGGVSMISYLWISPYSFYIEMSCECFTEGDGMVGIIEDFLVPEKPSFLS